MVIILSMSRRRIGRGNTANSTLGFTVDTQIDGLSVVMLDDAGKDSTDGITNITSPRFEISAREPLQSVTVILNGKSSTLTQGQVINGCLPLIHR